MIHDEKTTEIELPPHLVQKTKTQVKAQNPIAVSLSEFTVNDRRSQFTQEIEIKKTQSGKLSGPWLIRLLAVISILVLSLLV